MSEQDPHDPTALVIDAGAPVPNGGRLDDAIYPPAPFVVEADDAGCGCDEHGAGA